MQFLFSSFEIVCTRSIRRFLRLARAFAFDVFWGDEVPSTFKFPIHCYLLGHLEPIGLAAVFLRLTAGQFL